MFFDRKAFQRHEDGFSEEALAAVQTIVEPDRYKDAFEVLKMIRAECQFEMGQIGVRLSWLLAAQTLLVSAAVNAISNALNQNTPGPAWLAMLASGVSLVGVFLNNSVPGSTFAPSTLDFSTDASRSFTTLSPQLNQIFFIGDGRDDSGQVQNFVVPGGATRLFIGTWDSYEWNNNIGSFTVTVHAPGTVTTVH